MAAVFVLLAAGITVWALTGDDDDRAATLDPAQGDLHAQQACRTFDRFERLVGENARSDDVYDALDDLTEAADRAADADPRWRSLAGGAQALDVAFRNDNAQAARAGLDVTRAQCALTR